jgi:hypothetical protein
MIGEPVFESIEIWLTPAFRSVLVRNGSGPIPRCYLRGMGKDGETAIFIEPLP